MKTKEVTISNIKFNLSTKPLVSEPETYPDYPSVPDSSDNLCEDLSLATAGITFTIYFD